MKRVSGTESSGSYTNSQYYIRCNLDVRTVSVDIAKKSVKDSTHFVACVPPALDENHESVQKFFKPVEPLICPTVGADWIRVHNRTVFITSPEINCSIVEFWRVTDQKCEERQLTLHNRKAILSSDFFKAKCTNQISNVTFENVYATVVRRHATNAFSQDTGKRAVNVQQS